jgi:Methyltransferase domain
MRNPLRFKMLASNLSRLFHAALHNPRWTYHALSNLPDALRASEFCHCLPTVNTTCATFSHQPHPQRTTLWKYFDCHKDGRVIFKWMHYLDIYDRHFSKFVDRSVHVVEVGVLGGGSLEMWQHYFGDNCRVTGIDIDVRCKALENDRTAIFIGDQGDREFWRTFKERTPPIDVFIDDGGHTPEQQIVTLEETLPYLQPGGVYLCEDIHGLSNRFAAYAQKLADYLNAASLIPNRNSDFRIISKAHGFQSAVCSVHFYPFVVVIEKNAVPVGEFVCCARGAQ